MDDRNIEDLKDRAPSPEEWKKIHRMTEFCTRFTHTDHVPDPYYGGAEGFEYVLDFAGGCFVPGCWSTSCRVTNTNFLYNN